MAIDKPILFIHVPKTAGTSVEHALRNYYNWKIPPDHPNYQRPRPMHDPLFLIDRYNDLSNFFVFAIARNPFTRAFSYFKHYLKHNRCDIPFEQFLDHVRRKRQIIFNHFDSSITIKVDTTPFIVYSQSFYLYDSKGKMSLDKLYRYENLSELESDFDIQLPRANVGSYSKEDYIKEYTPTTTDLVRHIYLEDFINLNYSLDFV